MDTKDVVEAINKNTEVLQQILQAQRQMMNMLGKSSDTPGPKWAASVGGSDAENIARDIRQKIMKKFEMMDFDKKGF